MSDAANPTGNLPMVTEGVVASPVAQVPSVPHAQSAPGGEALPSSASSSGMDLATAQQIFALASGAQPLPETATQPAASAQATPYSAPTQTPAPAPQAPNPLEQQVAVLQAQIQAQQQYMQDVLARQMQAQQQVDPRAQMEAELRASGLNPADPVHQALYTQHVQMEQVRALVQQQQREYAALQQQARQYTLQSALESQIAQPFQAAGIASLPDGVKNAVVREAITYASQGASPREAVALAAKPFLDFYQATRPAPAPAPAPVVTAPLRVVPNNVLDAVSVQGRTAGRAERPQVTLDDMTKMIASLSTRS